MAKKLIKPIIFLSLILLIFIYYYIYLPVINIHSSSLWIFVISLVGITYVVHKVLSTIKPTKASPHIKKVLIVLGIGLIAIYLIGSILSSPIINADKYQSLLNVENGDFSKDIEKISYDEIPVLDKATAINLGSREMGSLVDMVSQFEVSNLYTQINYNERPTRVTPLEYGNLFKWLTNRKDGIPAYMRIDMTTQDIELINLPEGMKYSFSEPLNRNVRRHLRFNYPTYIFDTINFEINDDGVPYWIAPVRTYSIGLFGGPVIEKVITLNAVTGELEEYAVKDVPNWVDTVYSANLLTSYYNYHGMLKNGYFNSILGQKGCLMTTEGYNYIAIDNDVYVYSGVTSAGSDKSNVGFVLMNQRTSETKYYKISGAQETSAMGSAEGQVQNLGYRATFPLFLNIADQPTYFMALKDAAGLVKKYAMVNVERYQVVATGDTVLECENNYKSLLSENNIQSENKPESLSIKGNITYIKDVIIDGNTNIFIKIGTNNAYFVASIKESIDILDYKLGDNISIEYSENDDFNKIILIH